jgi:hypothetical protein
METSSLCLHIQAMQRDYEQSRASQTLPSIMANIDSTMAIVDDRGADSA